MCTFVSVRDFSSGVPPPPIDLISSFSPTAPHCGDVPIQCSARCYVYPPSLPSVMYVVPTSASVMYPSVSALCYVPPPLLCTLPPLLCTAPASAQCYVPLLCTPCYVPPASAQCHVPLVCTPASAQCYVPLLFTPCYVPHVCPVLCTPVMYPLLGPMGMAFSWRGCSLPTIPPVGRRSPC